MRVQWEHPPIPLNGNGDQQSATIREMVIGRAGGYADVLRQFALDRLQAPVSLRRCKLPFTLASKILAVRGFAAFYSRFPG
jgi:hypothetical protein